MGHISSLQRWQEEQERLRLQAERVAEADKEDETEADRMSR